MKIRVISLITALALLTPIFAASAEGEEQVGPVDRVYEGGVESYNLNTPEDNIFRIEGSDKEFILLDSEDGFYVLAKDQYGKRAFDPDATQKFDPQDENNIAYWLNHDFLENGNGVGNKLPDEIIRYIDTEREWFTEGGFPSGNCPEDYTVTCGVTLMSQTEWIKYIDKFGVSDDIGVYGWWLRTPRGKNGGTNMVICSMTTAERIGQTFGQDSSNSSQYYVRPAFVLKDEFFKEVRLDKIGNNVGAALAEHFEVSDFQGEGTLGYEDSFLRSIGFDIPFEIDDGQTVVSADILKKEYDMSLLPGSSLENIAAGDEEQYIKTGYAVNSRKNYELVLRAGFDGISTNDGVVLYAEYFKENGEKSGERNEILRLGGTREMTEYVTNLVSIPEGTDFMIFTLSISGGIGGNLLFDSLSLREINPEVTIINEWEPSYIIDPTSDSYRVRIECPTTLPKNFTTYYRLSYTADGYVYESKKEKLTLPTEGVCEYTVAMENLHRGNAILEIYVMYGNNVIESFSHEVSVTEVFDWSSDSGLPKHGVCTHPAQIERSDGAILDYIKQAGFNYIRGDFSWGRLEKGSKGSYDYSALDYIMEEVNKRDMELLAILCYSNGLYTSNDKTGIADNETLEAFLEYVRTVAKRYPEIKYFEVWNEPNNNGFWYPEANVNDYANFVKAVSRAIKEVRPDAYVIAGAIDISKNGPGWSRELFDLDIYPYIDAFSTHPYYHTALNDDKYLERVENYTDIVEDYGGWKDVYLTEAGWTTYGDKELDPTLASEDIKVLIHADYLDTRVSLFNMWDEGETFGLLNPDYSAKSSFSAVANYENQTAGAQFLTKLALDDDCHSFMYRKNNSPMIISWCYTGENKTLEFEKDVTVYDMYGNFVSKGKTVEQTDKPCYIYSSDRSLLAEGLKKRIGINLDEFISEYKGVIGEEAADRISEQKAKINSVDTAQASDIEEFYALGTQIMESLGESVFDPANTNMMYQYHKTAMEVADLYSLSQEDYKNNSEEVLSQADDKYNSLLTDASDTKRFSYELLRNSKKYADLAKEAQESPTAQPGLAAAYDEIALNLARWALAVTESEESENIGIHFQAVPGKVEAYEGENALLSVYVYNDRSTDTQGSLQVTSSKGDILAKAEGVTIPAGGKSLVALDIDLDSVSFGEDEFVIEFIGDVSAKTLIKADIQSKIDVVLNNSEKPADEITSLSLTLENKTESPISGTVTISPPEGWSISGEQEYALDALESSEIAVPVSQTEKTAFNYYVFDIEISDSSGNIISKLALPLDFSVIVKADDIMDPSEFDGDITDWSNAYPTYLNPPSDVGSRSEWQGSDLAARIFTKWDDNYFYLLADIYDDYQNQLNHESTIYDGDSLQLAFDTKNTKSGAYDADDYEYGFALTLTGEESYSWQAAEGKSSGVQPSEWCRVLRDEENKNTRYLVRIPKESLEPMSFTEGSVIGFNLVANDGNLLGPREGYAEITPGIASSKNTALYRNWTLSESESASDNGIDLVSSIFNLQMGEVNIFSDIGGHWAEEYISKAYSDGLVKGVGNNLFAPDSTLTIAEGLSLLARTLGTDAAEADFSDISGDEWYAPEIGGMQKADLIPAELVKDGKIEPERIITREEFAAVIAGCIDTQADDAVSFNDSSDISEWAREAVCKVAQSGIMVGDDENNFNPKGGLTRAEAAVIILNITNI